MRCIMLLKLQKSYELCSFKENIQSAKTDIKKIDLFQKTRLTFEANVSFHSQDIPSDRVSGNNTEHMLKSQYQC
jgi:hypothetical protein